MIGCLFVRDVRFFPTDATALMTLMPEADYCEILAPLFGDLAAVLWHVPFAVPTATVLAAWREAAGPEPLARLQEMVLAASAAEHEHHDYRAIEVGDLRLGSIDGSVTRMPDTPANRAEYESAAGTAMMPRRTRSCGTCWSPTPPPAARWQW